MKLSKQYIEIKIELDLFVDPKPLTKEEKKKISDFIKADKEKRRRNIKRKKPALVKA